MAGRSARWHQAREAAKQDPEQWQTWLAQERHAHRAPNLELRDNGIWHVRVKVRGVRERRSTGQVEFEKALTVSRQILDTLTGVRLGLSTRATPTLADWWRTYQDAYLPTVAPTTQQSYRYHVKRALAHNENQPKARIFFSGHRRLDEFTAPHCLQLLNALRKVGYAHNTVVHTAVVLKMVFQAAVKADYLAKNPWASVVWGTPQSKVRVLMREEQQRLLDALRPWDRRWVIVLLGTGLRLGELYGLTPDQVDWSRGLLHVVGKGRKLRSIPIVPAVAHALREQMQAEGMTGGTKRLWPRTACRFAQHLLRARRVAGLMDVTPHTLRHTFATRYIESNGNIWKLSRILGHSSVKTTEQIYLHESHASLVEDARRVDLGLPGVVPTGATGVVAKVVPLGG